VFLRCGFGGIGAIVELRCGPLNITGAQGEAALLLQPIGLDQDHHNKRRIGHREIKTVIFHASDPLFPAPIPSAAPTEDGSQTRDASRSMINERTLTKLTAAL
jgi:hypothetical protein